ncbi:glycosyltransferase family 4 protein [bacterium]|jgi:glycosyltransferase involved in cell wall biosynthesis|nr:glycosyltransferase family 4 protein [bacterium]
MNKYIAIVYNTTSYVYKFRINLIKEIKKLGYRVIVISPKDGYVDKLKEEGIEHHHINISQYGMNPLKELKTIYEIYKAFSKYNPEFSLHYTIKPNIFASIAAKLTNVKVINNIAGAGKAFSNDGLFQRFIQFLYKISLSKSQRVFFQNYDDMNLFLNNLIVEKDRAYRIPGSGVDLSKYVFSPLLDGPFIKFLFIGRLLKEKGIEYYLEAAKNVLDKDYDVKFYIVGEHEKEQKDYIDLEKLNIYLKNDNIIYLGAVSPDDMPKIIANTSCVVLPSYYREGVPRSLLESASMGKPIITTRNVGCKEVVDENKNGYKCEVKNSDCLVKSMIKFIDLPFKEKVKMSEYSRVKMENEFDEKIVLKAYISMIKSSK